jgi:primosomal protein N' (replication factor Y)
MRNWDNVAAGADEFSRPLASAVRRCLDEKRRVLIFLNRRGFSTYVQCQDCGVVETCPSCELPLILHSADGALLCHHCGYRTHAPSSCRKCKGVRFRFGGAGIEKVEAQLKKIAPSARVARMDLDSAGTREGALSAAGKFARGELDVLVGTLMVMKGLDLGEIALVGVLHAETQLNIPDFRSGERAFQLLSEVAALAGVAGEAGRRGGADGSGTTDSGATGLRTCPGEVVVQTLNPDHHSVTAVAADDPAVFYEQELKQREELGYPPFSTLVAVHISGPKEPQVLKVVQQAVAAASSIASSLEKQGLSVRVLGPSPAFPARSRGHLRWRMSIRAEKREVAHRAAMGILAELGGKHDVGGVTVSLDVDPVGA